MLAFGLSRKLCGDFLKKQAVIGNLDEGAAPPTPPRPPLPERGSPWPAALTPGAVGKVVQFQYFRDGLAWPLGLGHLLA